MVLGLHGSGMHDWIMDELELGARVAHCLDSENNCGWSALMDLSYMEYVKAEQERNTVNGVCVLCGSAVLDGEHLRRDLAPCYAASPVDF